MVITLTGSGTGGPGQFVRAVDVRAVNHSIESEVSRDAHSLATVKFSMPTGVQVCGGGTSTAGVLEILKSKFCLSHQSKQSDLSRIQLTVSLKT